LPDEEACVTKGPLHPIPPPPPRWSGSDPPAANDEIPAESNVGSAMNVDGVGIAADGGGPSRWEEHVAPNEVLDV